MTALEQQMYLALLGARTIVAATANVNPRALPVLKLIDGAKDKYKYLESTETAPLEEIADAARE